MMDRTHDDKGAKVSAIIVNELSELIELGVETRDAAAKLMACQAIVRIEDNEARREVEQFAISWCGTSTTYATEDRVPDTVEQRVTSDGHVRVVTERTA